MTNLTTCNNQTPRGGPVASYELLGALLNLRYSSPIPGRVLILSGGNGEFAVQIAEYLGSATVVNPDGALIARAKAKPLSSAGAVYRQLAQAKPTPLHLMPLPICPSVQYRCASLENSGLQSGTFSCVIVEQGHHADRPAVMEEARRLTAKGGLIVALSYYAGHVISKAKPTMDRSICDSINELVRDFIGHTLTPLLTRGEREVLQALQHGGDAAGWNPDFRRRAVMRGTWNLVQFVEQMKSWPVIQRIEGTPASLHVITQWNIIAELGKRWGAAKVRRVINWPVLIETEIVGGD